MIVIGIPTMGTVPIEIMADVVQVVRQHGDNVVMTTTKMSLVYDARYILMQEALKNDADLMFLDSDIHFTTGAFNQLLAHKKPIVSGLYYGKGNPSNPIAYTKVRPKRFFMSKPICEQLKKDEIEPFMEVEGVGLGFCLIRNEVLKAVDKEGFNPFEPFGNLGEDFAFLYRCRQKGYKIWLDTTLGLKHIGSYEYGR